METLAELLIGIGHPIAKGLDTYLAGEEAEGWQVGSDFCSPLFTAPKHSLMPGGGDATYCLQVIDHHAKERLMLRRVFNCMREPAFVLDRDNRIELANRAAAVTFYGTTDSSSLHRLPFEQLSEELSSFYTASHRQTALERNLTTAQGIGRFQISIERLTEGEGPVAGTVVVMNDITALRKSQEELEQKIADRAFDLAVANEQLQTEMTVRLKVGEELKAVREFMSALLEHAPAPVFARDRDNRFLMVNRAWEEASGIPRGQAIGRRAIDIFTPETAAAYDAIARTVLNRRCACHTEETIDTPRGQRIFQMVRFPLFDDLGEVETVGGIALDVTDRRTAEEMLMESEKRFRALFENSIDGIQLSRPNGTILAANPAACRMLGRSEAEICVIGNDGIIDRSDQRFLALQEELAAKGSCTGELSFLRGDGSRFPVGLSCSVFKDRLGVDSIVTVWRDISERKKNEAALLESEERYRNLVELSTNAIYITIEGRLVFSNRAGVRLLGATEPDEVLGSALLDFIHPEFHTAERERVRMLRDDGLAPLSMEERYVTLEGAIVDVDVAAIPFTFQDQPAILVLARDITERKKLEQELEKNARFESIGLLAGGIAHDFNNLLAAILGNISLSKMLTPEDAEAFHILSEAETASLRARDLTRQLLTFARGGAPVKKSATIGELIKETCAFALRGSNVSCIFDFPTDLSNVEVDVGQISQVVQNLVINADQSMPDGGTLVVVCENVAGAEIPAQLSGSKYVRISIRDTGHGIHPDHLNKIFDPYFTTKQKGSGLGLSTAYSIVRKHDGYLAVESELGTGTVFHIYLPAGELPAQPQQGAVPLPFSGNGKILFMDDEEAVRFIAGRTLRRMGFEVTFAKDGLQAVKLYQEALWGGEPFTAVVMDLTIPGGMGGKEAVRLMKELDPDLTAFVSSGYSDDPVMADPSSYGFRGVIPKPFLYEEMVAALQNVFGRLDHKSD